MPPPDVVGGKHPGGGFFAVDRRTWARVCELGMNPAVAYLVLARGTGADNRITAWSVLAIETYTGISRGRARAAVKTLQDANPVKVLRAGTRPKYDLLPWSELNGADVSPRKPMTERQRAVYDAVASGEQPTGADRQAAYGLAHKGWLLKDGSGKFEVAPEVVNVPDWIWLPNQLVTGAADEMPPVELVRQVQDVMALRLLVDFYHAQNLREDGGIGREFTYESFERFEVGRQGQFVVWGFRRQSTLVKWNQLTKPHRRDEDDLTEEEKEAGKNAGVDFFRRLEHLTALGLIEWVPHLFESDAPDAEIIHPLGMGRTDTAEDRLGIGADIAGRALLTERQREWAGDNGLLLVPVLRHIANAQVTGVARLKYRPHTRRTSAWWADLQTKGERWVEEYANLAARDARKIAVI